MKHVKKIFAFALTLVMAFAIAVPAFAADDGSLTVTNTTSGKEYNIYKVFDATYSGEKVAYTYDGSNATFLAALQAADSPFTTTKVGSTNTYTVVRKDGVTDDTILTFIKGQKDNLGTAIGTENGNGGSVSFTGLAYGYYFVTSELGSVVTIDSALKDVEVIDKNQEITVDKQEQVANGTWQYQGIDTVEDPVPTAGVGDTVNYKVTGTYTRYVGEDKVTALKFTDTMSTGLTANKDVKITIGGVDVTDKATISYKVDAQTNKTETSITLPVLDANKNFIYDNNATYEVTYSAKINKEAIVDGEEENTVDLKYTDENGQDKDVDTDTTKVKNYDVTLLKNDGKNTAETTDDSPLAGAKFKLYAQGGTTAIKLVLLTGDSYGDGTVTATKDNTYRVAEAGETANVIEEVVVGTTGKIEIKGLANGSYEFEETEAPAGYNKLTARTEVATITNADGSVTVVNNSGSELPSTGGIGTTIFYIVGGAMVVGGGIFLLTKRRMANEA